MYLSRNVKYLRELSGWTHKELQKRSGVFQQTTSALELKTDTKPNLVTLIKLSNAFAVTLDELLYANFTKEIPKADLKKMYKLLMQENYVLKEKLNELRAVLEK